MEIFYKLVQHAGQCQRTEIECLGQPKRGEQKPKGKEGSLDSSSSRWGRKEEEEKKEIVVVSEHNVERAGHPYHFWAFIPCLQLITG